LLTNSTLKPLGGKRELAEEKRLSEAVHQTYLEEVAKEEECAKLKQELADLKQKQSYTRK